MDMGSLLALQTEEHLATLRQAQGQSPDAFVLSHSKQRDWPLAAMAEQLACRKKLKAKLPDWQDHDVLMTSRLFEQSSSAWCAAFKATLCPSTPQRILDICGGLGVDAMAFAAAGHQVTYNDIDPIKAALCQWNAQQLQIPLVNCLHTDAGALLAETAEDAYDIICADPSRRTAGGQRVNKLADCEPRILELMPLLRRASSYILLKLAPSMSIAALCADLPGVERILCVSLDGELKECLVWIRSNAEKSAPRFEAVCLRRHGTTQIIEATPSEQQLDAAELREGAYIYEPDPAIIHAQAIAALTERYPLQLLSTSHPQWAQANAILFAADTLYADFPGRVFQVHAHMPYNKKRCRKYLQSHSLKTVHVWRCQSTRSVATLRKELAVSDGHAASVLVYRGLDEQEYLVHALRMEIDS